MTIRPSEGYFLKGSQHIGFIGFITTNAQSPFLIDFGSFSITLPSLLIVAWISTNLQATCAVWQQTTGVQPGFIVPGCFKIMIFARNSWTSLGGSSNLPQTYPRFRSRIGTPLRQIPTISPGFAQTVSLWCLQMDFTSHLMPEGARQTSIPGLSVPESTLPIATVPTPPILQIFRMGNRSGLSVGLFVGALIRSTASSKVGPSYQGMLADLSTMLSPSHAEVGMKITFSGLYPTFLTQLNTSAFTQLYRFSEQLTVLSSILFRQTINCFTPRAKAKRVCQRVCPCPCSYHCCIPASYSPSRSPITKKAQSA